ncbi:MAG: hypothetical protein Q9198_004865 [Flavoplaca austrocitrina]
MYKWYEEAKICYVYLSDFFLEQAQHSIGIAFRRSRWFTRGWTLQELLAPEDVVFYDADWTEIGSKTFLKDTLSQICRISVQHLSRPKGASVATKMSWASTRETTRKEDTAYCLLGLFGVNMPLIYGEGANAFFRLQCEIIQSSSDESIFAWKETPTVRHAFAYSGLLATGPWSFEESGGIVPTRLKNLPRPPYFLTNQGLSIEVNPTGGGIHRECLDDFEKSLSLNRDPRLDGRVQRRSNIIQTVLACALESNKEAPVILTLGIIDGKLASRISCETLEFDFDALQANNSGSPILQVPTQVCIVGQQRGSGIPENVEYIAARLDLASTSRIVLTPAFQEVFKLDKTASRSFTNLQDGSILVHHEEAGVSSDEIGLHFISSLEYRFFLQWDNSECFNQIEYFFQFSDTGAATTSLGLTRNDVRTFSRAIFRKRVGTGDNLNTAIDDKLFLWISTSRTPDRQCSVVLDVTPIDRSKALHFSLDSD